MKRRPTAQDPTATSFLASGIVPGHALNQFAMDEYKDVLRIATSKGQVPDPEVESVLSVLKQNGANLETIGQIGGIAPTEDIRSVRFQGDRGYVVTFKKTDPLFVLDLADPSKPLITGELKIPGFSTYMHPLDAGYLLALGYEADDQGSFAYFNGIQLQIFDVTSPTEPKLLHKQVYGTRGSSSSALTDHLGFTFLPARNLLTLPMSICDGGGSGSFGALSFSGVVAMNVSLDNGISELGRLEEPVASECRTSPPSALTSRSSISRNPVGSEATHPQARSYTNFIHCEKNSLRCDRQVFMGRSRSMFAGGSTSSRPCE